MCSTLNNIIDGISIKISETFGDKYQIYSEQIKQGFKEPCFFIHSLSQSSKQIVGNRYQRYHAFDIHFFPKSSFKQNEAMNSVAEKLLETMEYINVDSNLMRGTKMHIEKVDDVLHFFVEFNLHAVRPKERLSMEELTIGTGLKGERN